MLILHVVSVDSVMNSGNLHWQNKIRNFLRKINFSESMRIGNYHNSIIAKWTVLPIWQTVIDSNIIRWRSFVNAQIYFRYSSRDNFSIEKLMQENRLNYCIFIGKSIAEKPNYKIISISSFDSRFWFHSNWFHCRSILLHIILRLFFFSSNVLKQFAYETVRTKNAIN